MPTLLSAATTPPGGEPISQPKGLASSVSDLHDYFTELLNDTNSDETAPDEVKASLKELKTAATLTDRELELCHSEQSLKVLDNVTRVMTQHGLCLSCITDIVPLLNLLHSCFALSDEVKAKIIARNDFASLPLPYIRAYILKANILFAPHSGLPVGLAAQIESDINRHLGIAKMAGTKTPWDVAKDIEWTEPDLKSMEPYSITGE